MSDNEVYDAAIILCQEIDKDKNFKIESKERLNAGAELYKRGVVKSLIMSGGYLMGNNFPTADCMANYAMEKEVAGKDILLENISLDTIGQLVFSKEGVIDPKNFKKIMIITHDYHVPRCLYIANFFFDENYELNFRGISPDNTLEGRKKRRQDMMKIASFIKSFGNKLPKNGSLLEILIKKHQWYNGKYPWSYPEKRDADFFRKELERLVGENS